jgi:hypothetical protein
MSKTSKGSKTSKMRKKSMISKANKMRKTTKKSRMTKKSKTMTKKSNSSKFINLVTGTIRTWWRCRMTFWSRENVFWRKKKNYPEFKIFFVSNIKYLQRLYKFVFVFLALCSTNSFSYNEKLFYATRSLNVTVNNPVNSFDFFMLFHNCKLT